MTRAEFAMALLETSAFNAEGGPAPMVVETPADHLLSITEVHQLENGTIAVRCTWGDMPV